MRKEFFINELKKIIIHSFNSIEDKEDILSFGIYACPRSESISLMYNTSSHLNKLYQEAKGKTPKSYFKWCIVEWKYDIAENNEKLDKFSSLLNQYASHMAERFDEMYPNDFKKEDEAYSQFSDEVLNWQLETLLEVKNEGLFSDIKNKNFFLYLGFSEIFCLKDEIDRIKKLLGEEKFKLFEIEVINNPFLNSI